jgi:5'-nucleotidase (lipoprotein e(P4) family)
MKKHLAIIGLILLMVSVWNSCNQSSAFNKPKGELPEVTSNEHLTMAVLYHQTAAEYRALCYQAFNLATLQLDKSMRIMGLMKQQAVIVDIDETVLDNSSYEAKCILDNISYPQYWDEWMNKSNAQPVPGSQDFLKYAESQKVEIFYVTNRREKYRKQTLENLQKLGFPFADDDHLLMRTDESSKEPRRERISDNHAVILLIGDNLNDFAEAFEAKSVSDRMNLTDQMKTEFGNRFIVLPNPMYGDWESAMYDYNNSLTPVEKSKARLDHLKSF